MNELSKPITTESEFTSFYKKIFKIVTIQKVIFKKAHSKRIVF